MDPKTQQQLDELEIKVDAMHKSVKKMLFYMQVTAWVTIILFVVPLIGLLFAIPALLGTMNDAMSILQY